MQLSPSSVLDKAINIANSLGVLPYTIQSGSVEARDLGSQQAWGLFEMVQSPDMPDYNGVAMAWDDRSKKLLIDVNAIIRHYSANAEALQADYTKYKEQIDQIRKQNRGRGMTLQYDGMEPDVRGVSSDSPLNVVNNRGAGGVPAVQSVPSVGAVPSR